MHTSQAANCCCCASACARCLFLQVRRLLLVSPHQDMYPVCDIQSRGACFRLTCHDKHAGCKFRYVHAGIVHRDLKLENIFLSDETPEASAMIGDFGCSAFCYPGHRLDCAEIGTLPYCAPELLNADHSHQADFWSLGVVLYCMLSGSMPFDGDDGEHPAQEHLCCSVVFWVIMHV